MELGALLAFWLAFTLAVMSPGPNFTVLLATSVTSGRSRAFKVAVGMVAGEIVWGLAAVFGVAALAAHSPAIGLALRVGGGLYLLWLASCAWRSAGRGHARAPGDQAAAKPARATEPAGGTGRGFLLMLLNAKAGFFWISLTSLILIMSAGPSARVIGDFPVALPRPRDIAEIRHEPSFQDLHRRIWHALKDEVLKGYRQVEGS